MKSFFSLFFIIFIGFFTQNLFANEASCSADGKSCQHTFRPYVYIDQEGKDFIFKLSLKEGESNNKETSISPANNILVPVTYNLEATSINKNTIYYRLRLMQSTHKCTDILQSGELSSSSTSLEVKDIKVNNVAFNSDTGLTDGDPFVVGETPAENVKAHQLTINFPEIPKKSQAQQCEGSLLISAEAPL